MSIINDALKKTQANLEKGKDQNAATPPTPAPEGEKKDISKLYEKMHRRHADSNTPSSGSSKTTEISEPQKSHFWKLPLLILAFAGLLGYYLNTQFHWVNRSPIAKKIFSLDFDFLKKKPKRKLVRKVVRTSTPPPVQQAAAPASQPPTPAPTYTGDKMTLAGIMVMGDRTIALINGKPYEVGQIVGDKRIASMTSQTVDLVTETGETITLHVGEAK